MDELKNEKGLTRKEWKRRNRNINRFMIIGGLSTMIAAVGNSVYQNIRQPPEPPESYEAYLGLKEIVSNLETTEKTYGVSDISSKDGGLSLAEDIRGRVEQFEEQHPIYKNYENTSKNWYISRHLSLSLTPPAVLLGELAVVGLGLSLGRRTGRYVWNDDFQTSEIDRL